MRRAHSFSTWTLLEHLFRLMQRQLAQEVRGPSRVCRKHIIRYKYQIKNVLLFSHHSQYIPAVMQIGLPCYNLQLGWLLLGFSLSLVTLLTVLLIWFCDCHVFILSPWKEFLWVVGMVVLKATHSLPTVVFLWSPMVLLLAKLSRGYHCQICVNRIGT